MTNDTKTEAPDPTDNPWLRCGCGAAWPCAQHPHQEAKAAPAGELPNVEQFHDLILQHEDALQGGPGQPSIHATRFAIVRAYLAALATPTEAKQEDAPSPEQAEDAARLTDEQIDELWDWAPDYEPDPNQVLKRRAFARSIAARKDQP